MSSRGLVRKAGAWYTYDGEQLGQGKENVRNFLRDNPDIADEIEKRIKEKLGVGARIDQDEPLPTPVDFDRSPADADRRTGRSTTADGR